MTRKYFDDEMVAEEIAALVRSRVVTELNRAIMRSIAKDDEIGDWIINAIVTAGSQDELEAHIVRYFRSRKAAHGDKNLARRETIGIFGDRLDHRRIEDITAKPPGRLYGHDLTPSNDGKIPSSSSTKHSSTKCRNL